MATALTNDLKELREHITRFASATIAPRKGLHTEDGFPHDLWQKMGEANIMGIGIPEQYGGRGGTYLAISTAGEALARAGHNMGITLSWVIHQVVSRFIIYGFGTDEQRQTYLPRMAGGEITASIAISEPEAKAHPKYLTTWATAGDGHYTINGTKSFLTNGTIADVYIVLAITAVDAHQRKEFTAFLVPKETNGVSITKEIAFNFLQPSPHCEITLHNSPVPPSNVLGETGKAYTHMAKPFRDVEEVCLMGPVIGGMERQLEILVASAQNTTISRPDELQRCFGHLRFMLDTLRIVAYEAAHMLDSGIHHPEFLSLLLSLRHLSGNFQSYITGLLSEFGIEKDAYFDYLTNDLIQTVNIAKYVALIKQQKLGEATLHRKEFIT